MLITSRYILRRSTYTIWSYPIAKRVSCISRSQWAYPSSLNPTVPHLQDQFNVEKGDNQAGSLPEEPVKLTCNEVEQIVVQCTKEHVNDLHKEIDGLQKVFEKKL